MSLRRFVGYFFALSACSTVAFASCLMGNVTPQEAAAPIEDAPGVSLVPVFAKHHLHTTPRRHALPKVMLAARAD